MALGAVAFINKLIGEENLAEILQDLDLYESTLNSVTMKWTP
jgi:hypothetical protein